MPESKPLAGIRIVEIATYVAAPSAGMALAQLGADVIRIDPLGGAHDRTRWPLAATGASLYWMGLNKGKRSLAVDLRSEEGQRIVVDLIAEAGIVLHNQVGRRWLDDAFLRERRPDLIHVSLEGRRGGGGALDYTVNARTGLPFITGPVEEEGVVNHALPAWDFVAGAELRSAVLAALVRRGATGKGSHVTIALEDVAISTLADLGWLAEADLTGKDRPRHGTAVYGTYGDAFRTRDGRYIFVMAMTERQWSALVTATGIGDGVAALAARRGVALDSDAERYAAREEISALLAPWFAAHDAADAGAQLAEAGALTQEYLTMTELAQDAAASAELVERVDHPGAEGVLTSRGPAIWDGAIAAPLRARALGADVDDILTEVLGRGGDEVRRLRETGVVA